MNTFLRRFGFLTFLTFLFSFQIALVQAQEQETESPPQADIRYAALSLSDAKVLEFPGGAELSVSAVVQNIFSEKRGYQVGVEFRGVSDGNQDEVFIWRSPEEVFFEGKQDQVVGFSVPKPTWLSGKYRLTLGMNDRHGNRVALVPLGEKEFSHQGRVEIKSCLLADVQSDGLIHINALGILGTCGVVWNGAQDELVRLVTQVTSTRYGAPKVLGQSDTVARTDSFAAGNVVVSEMTEPGVYYLEIVPTATGGHAVGVPFMTTVMVTGSGGKLLGVTRYDGEHFRSGETVPVTAEIRLYDESEYELLLELSSNGVSCADPIRATLQGVSTHEAEFVLQSNCVAPKVMAILSLEGKQVDQWITNDDTPMANRQSEERGFAEASPWIILGGVAALALAAGYLIKRRTRARRMMMPLLFVIFAIPVFFGLEVKWAEAASQTFYLNCDRTRYACMTANTLFIDVGTDKDSYAPNEPIDIYISLGSDDAPYAPTNPVVRINGGSDLVPGSYNRGELTGGVDVSASGVVNAPAVAGPFTITVTVGSSGYITPAAHQISLTVAAATPTASLSVSPRGPVPEGTLINYVLSSTNAQSCEVERDPGNWIELPRSANTTSMNISGPTGAGNWTFTTRCWSGTNGSGSVSSTDTDTLVITAAATGSFTSTPACTIAANGAGCNTTLGWTSSGAATVVLTNCADAFLASRGTGSQSASGIYVPYNSGCYRIHSGAANGPVLDQVTVSSSCTGGTSWNGSSCQAAARVDGVCGSANDGGYTDTGVLLASGTMCSRGAVGNGPQTWKSSDSFDSNGNLIPGGPGYFLGVFWQCMGQNGGNNSEACVAYRQPPLCGSANGRTYTGSMPTDNAQLKQVYCQVGDMRNYQVAGTNVSWTCHNKALSQICAATLLPPAGTPPIVDITATGPVTFENQKWWQKALSWVMGGEVVAAGNASITTSQRANISWTSSGADGCDILGPLINSTTRNNAAGTVVSGAALGVGTHTYSIQCRNASGSSPVATARVIVSDAAGGCCGTGGAGDDVPNGLSATAGACGTRTISVSWSPVSGATSYTLRDGATTIYSGTSTNYDHTGLVTGSSHSYTVRSNGPAGNSGYSGSVVRSAPSACGAICGNGITEGSEQCDTGGARGTCPAACSNSCTTNVCAGVVNGVCGPAHLGAYVSTPPAGSRCTAGSSSAVNNNGDFWQWNCVGSGGGTTQPCWATVIPSGVCGDGNVDAGEQCDAGGANGSCPAACSNSCTTNVCAGGAPQCDFNHYNCISGSSIERFDAGAFWSWQCQSAGYPNAVCSEFKVASGQILGVTSCFIPSGQSICPGLVTWNTTSLINPVLEVGGATPAQVFSASENNRAFDISYGSHAVTLRDAATLIVYDTDVLIADCVAGTGWNIAAGRCDPAPAVSLTVNGSTGPITAAPGDTLTITWTVSGATDCTASGKWSGAKSTTGGTENATAAVPSGDYILSCQNASGVVTTRQVTVNLACTASTSSWSACGPPCAGGNGSRSRTVTTNACVVTTEEESCTTTTCRDLNWKEVGQ
jgi:hypothetical protein